MIQKLKVWWTSRFGSPAMNINVASVDEAKLILKALAKYDLYLGDIITSNAGGLEVFENGEWSEYYNDEGRDIDEIMEDAE